MIERQDVQTQESGQTDRGPEEDAESDKEAAIRGKQGGAQYVVFPKCPHAGENQDHTGIDKHRGDDCTQTQECIGDQEVREARAHQRCGQSQDKQSQRSRIGDRADSLFSILCL